MSFETEYSAQSTDIDNLLKFSTDSECSDLFIKVGEPAFFARYGMMYQTMNPVTSVDWNKFVGKAITSEQNTKYVREKMLDFSYQIKSGNKIYRYRASAGYSTGANICTFRMITHRLPDFESLKLDNQVVSLLSKAFSMKNGIMMICGVTGSGKTSTLAACINSFSSNANKTTDSPLKDAHLITMEDPIEYVYPSKTATRIVQKELGRDFKSFDNGIKQALREHPTHILVGETRDKETIRALVEAARTGHSTISTFHTGSVSDTIARLNSYLSGENQDIMFDLVANLNFILCQNLIKGRKGYKLNYQYMFFTPQIKKILTEAIYKDKNIPNTVEMLISNKELKKAGICHGWLYES